MAVKEPKHGPVLELILQQMSEKLEPLDDGPNFVGAIWRILDGERDAEILYGNLGFHFWLAIDTILQGLSDVSAIADLLPREGLPILGLEPGNFEGLRSHAATKTQEAKELIAKIGGTPNQDTRHKLQRYADLILGTVGACAGEALAREFVAREQNGMRTGGATWTALADVIDRILAGERNLNALCDGLESGPFIIAGTILHGLSDNAALHDLPHDS